VPVIFVSGKRKAGPNAPTVLALVKADLEVDNTVSGPGSTPTAPLVLKTTLYGQTRSLLNTTPAGAVLVLPECLGLICATSPPDGCRTHPTSIDLTGSRWYGHQQATVLSEEQMRQYDVAPYQRLVGCGMPMASVEVQCVQVKKSTHTLLAVVRLQHCDSSIFRVFTMYP